MSYENPTLQVGHLALKSAHSLYVVCSQDCATGLKCFQRNTFQPVPGCLGQGVSGSDYCYRPWTTDGDLTIVGNNGIPAGVFPLKRCQGDCDSDNGELRTLKVEYGRIHICHLISLFTTECATGLFCFQRTGTGTVPGCRGTGSSGQDYCYDPRGGDPVPAPVAPAPTSAPMYLSPTSAPVPVVVTPTDPPLALNPPTPSPVTLTTAPMVAPTEAPLPSLQNAGDNGSPSSAFPLKNCQGDCDAE